MGIRIKKVLGYGFVDLKTDEYELADDRFNPEWVKNRWVGEPEGKSIEEYFEYSRANYNADPEEKLFDVHLFPDIGFRHKKPELHHFLTWDSEFGLPNVMVLTPITGLDWVRHDDTLDYYEEQANGKFNVEPHAKVLDVPLYPYDSYIEKETGARASNDVREWIYQFRNSTLELKNPKLGQKMYGVHMHMISMALEALECSLHWTEKWNVGIPEQIQDYCKYVEMFKDNKTIFSMVPIIYTYWS